MSAYSDGYGQRANPGGRAEAQTSCGMGWKPIEIVAMILGFIVFWPIGLAILLAKLWQKKQGYAGDIPSFVEAKFREKWQGKWEGKMRRHWACHGTSEGRHWEFRSGMRSSGNVAFDEWREAELARLEEERQKLLASEREFADYMENLRRAKDREEFDRFMAARRDRPNQNNGPTQPSA